MPYQPTTDDLKAAFERGGLWRLGWTFERALTAPAIRTALECSAKAHSRTQQGKPAPMQPALI